MREIEFRVWDKSVHTYEEAMEDMPPSGKMVDWKYVKESNCLLRVFNGEYPIMQFTGLKDKNGKKIFEGDILDLGQTVNGCKLFSVEWSDKRIGWTLRYTEIMKNPREYEYDVADLFKIDYTTGEGVEVIGNIHENPELL